MNGRHRWKNAGQRNDYALVHSPKKGWVRIFRVGDNLLIQRFHDNSIVNI